MTGAPTLERREPPPAVHLGSGPIARSGSIDSTAGIGHLVRLVLRRDRLRIALWWTAIVGLIVVTAASITGLYHTPAELETYGRLVRGNSALIVQSGPGYGLDNPTTGAIMMNESAIWTIIGVALMSVFMTVRHTRTEEESERAELIRAAPVGRHAPLVAALIGVAIADALVAAGSAVALIAYGLPLWGSFAFGMSIFGAGLVFAGVAAVAAQVASGSRPALGLGGAVLGLSFVLRAVGDVGNGVLSWASPIGWAQAIRAYADERWWALALPLLATTGLILAAVALQNRRDFGAGLVAPRAGAAAAGPRLASPLGLAVRLQRASVLGWAMGVGVTSFFYGIVADQAESMIRDNPDLGDFFAQLGGASITDAFLSTSVLILALMATGFTISSVLRLRSEELAGRTDALLAASVSRRWLALGHLTVAVVGTVVIMVTAGFSIGLGFALVSGDASQIVRMLAAALVMVPAMLLVAGGTFALYGLIPRASLVIWGFYAWVAVAGILATVLRLPGWTLDLSPFQHVPALPAASMSWLPVIALLCVAGGLVAVGLAALDHRDMS
jgi:ABC-2 type transport system permease protein